MDILAGCAPTFVFANNKIFRSRDKFNACTIRETTLKQSAQGMCRHHNRFCLKFWQSPMRPLQKSHGKIRKQRTATTHSTLRSGLEGGQR